jgi:hypothetical protein
MKSILGLVLALFSLSVFAYSPFQDVPAELCPQLKSERNSDVAFCKADNSKVVLAAKTGAKLTDAEYKKFKFDFIDAVTLGIIPDADSNQIFFYKNKLVDGNGKLVGYKSINGWENYEMEARGRVDVRYNLKGQIVSIELKQF